MFPLAAPTWAAAVKPIQPVDFPAHIRPEEKAFADLAEKAPSSAGFYYDSTGSVVLAGTLAATLQKNKSKFPDPKKLTTIADLGGWPKLNDELFDPEKGKIAKIEGDAGVSTAK